MAVAVRCLTCVRFMVRAVTKHYICPSCYLVIPRQYVTRSNAELKAVFPQSIHQEGWMKKCPYICTQGVNQ